LFRWIRRGVKRADGTVVKLEAVRLGSRWITSREALSRFVASLTNPDSPSIDPPRTPGQRRRASERAAERLAELGI
jgi:hypothetical protein